ncbi:MAG: hypothetical protein LQ348_002812, partial [Seirophora lacunosa]
MAPARQGARQRARREVRKAQLRSGTHALAELSANAPYTSKFTEALGHDNFSTKIPEEAEGGKIVKGNGVATEGRVSGETTPLIENQTATTYAGIVKDSSEAPDRVVMADVLQRLAGPAPPPLRGFPAFPQPNPSRPNQNLQLGSGRLHNANKLGNGATWGLGAVNGAPGLPNAQGRNTTNTSFAQTIGASQPATPLDLSEFPSLSGNHQTQYQNPGQAVWGQSNQRGIQHTPVQRPQPQQPPPQQPNAQQQQQHQQSSQVQEQAQQSRDDLYPGTQFTGSNDEYRRGGQGGIGQLGASGQPQPNSIEEFPPLGRNGTDDNQDRRGSLMQSAAFGGFANAFTLPSNQNQTRRGIPSSQSSQPDSGRSSTLVERLTSPNSLNFAANSNRPGLTSAAEPEKSALVTPRANAPNNINSLLSSFQNHSIGTSSNSTLPQQLPSRQQQAFQASGASQTAENTPLDQMAPIDRWGLAGLLATIRSDNADVAGLAIGQDLTQLGLDLNSQEPLWPTWSGPFAEPSARPLQADFQLPECYTVDNVHRLRDKIPSFSDETLFWIFYTQPRDLMQELAASELTGRNWRYHKDLMMWLTKDTAFGEPVPLGDGTERGSYIFFNQRTWQRARSEFVLT